MQFNVITFQQDCQGDILEGSEGFPLKKKRSIEIATAYSLLYSITENDRYKALASSISNCSNFLIYGINSDGSKTLKGVSCCRSRLCPVCTWRRSLKTFSNVKKVTDYMQTHDKYNKAFIMLTLTIRNVSGDELKNACDEMYKGLQRLRRYPEIKLIDKGIISTFEITHNREQHTYHPHFHLMIAVNRRYFKSKEYISQARFTELWKDAMRLDYQPVINVKKIGNNADQTAGGAVAEISKYCVKDSDLIDYDDWKMSADALMYVDDALRGRHLINRTGIFRELHRRLNLDDEEDGDLIHIDESQVKDEIREDVYFWHSGFSQYRKLTTTQDIVDM